MHRPIDPPQQHARCQRETPGWVGARLGLRLRELATVACSVLALVSCATSSLTATSNAETPETAGAVSSSRTAEVASPGRGDDATRGHDGGHDDDRMGDGSTELQKATTLSAPIPHLATARDWDVAAARLAWIWEDGLHTLEFAELFVRVARSFVGTPYRAHSLDRGEDEVLVVRLTSFDCVTLIEHSWVLSSIAKVHGPELLDDREALIETYARLLTAIRYRRGEPLSYTARLHYFSDWLNDAESKAMLRVETTEIARDLPPERGPLPVDARPIDYMTRHAKKFRRLLAEDVKEAMLSIEASISERPRPYIHEAQILAVEEGIAEGDIIATRSTSTGLDVAHTGIAVRIRGRLHLLHAPLRGGRVEISADPIHRRIRKRRDQDGIIVARPLGPPQTES